MANWLIKSAFLVLILVCISCKNESIDNPKKRNSNWAWVTDLDGSNQRWVKVGGKKPIQNCYYTLFYDNGNIIEKGVYKNGEIADTTFFYDKNERLIKFEYQKDGHELAFYPMDGEYTQFYSSGELAEIGYVEDGKLVGKWTKYYQDGNIKAEGTTRIENENATGWIVSYHENGYKKDSLYRLNGGPHGDVKYWYSNGQLEEETKWHLGKKEGTLKLYYPNGNLRLEAFNINGKYNGNYIAYYPNSLIYKKMETKNGKAQGPCKIFYPNGQLFTEGHYQLGNLDGAWHCYSSNGKQYVTEVYDNNVLIYSKSKQELSSQEKEDLIYVRSFSIFDKQNLIVEYD